MKRNAFVMALVTAGAILLSGCRGDLDVTDVKGKPNCYEVSKDVGHWQSQGIFCKETP